MLPFLAKFLGAPFFCLRLSSAHFTQLSFKSLLCDWLRHDWGCHLIVNSRPYLMAHCDSLPRCTLRSKQVKTLFWKPPLLLYISGSLSLLMLKSPGEHYKFSVLKPLFLPIKSESLEVGFWISQYLFISFAGDLNIQLGARCSKSHCCPSTAVSIFPIKLSTFS